uniref:RRM domain-containing protein n=1 Tax=Oryza rufipogon TaxID=4529 RepID=A0A0E0R4W6_ORYRU
MAAAAPAGAQNRCVFVGNIPYDATEEQLVQICEEVGPVVSFRLVIDKETGKPKGYGFCEYKDEETALSARRNLQGYEINGRQLRVDFAENGRNADRNREKVEDPQFLTVEETHFSTSNSYVKMRACIALVPMNDNSSVFSNHHVSYVSLLFAACVCMYSCLAGRGGPGMASSVDTQKQLAGTPVVGDTGLHQPVGLPSAIHAASVMAGILGGSQTANVQNGLPVQYGLGNDPLTHYLARMSKHQLYEIMSELKSLTSQNKDVANKLLQGIPQLSKALFQSQIMLGMVTPQMMQMAKSQQPSSSLAQLSSHISEPFPQPDAMISSVPRPSASLPNPNVLQDPSAQLHNFPQYPHSSQPAGTIFPHGSQSGVGIHPPIVSQPLGASSSVPPLPLATSGSLISQVQPPFMPHHPRPPAMPAGMQQLPLTHPHVPQVPAIPDIAQKEMRFPEQANRSTEFAHHPKLRKLEDGTSTPGIVNNNPAVYPAPSQGMLPGGPSGSYNSAAVSFQQPENEVPQLTPDVESALLQQVLQLTPEQLSSLPVEQQQQVIQLQKMLSAGK